MMEMDLFIQKIFAAAEKAGICPAEIYCEQHSSFSARAMEGRVAEYEVAETGGLSLRGAVNGKMGYASTEAYDDAAIAMLIRGVLESASLTETQEQYAVFAGEKSYPVIENPRSDLDQVSAEEKLQFCLRLENAAVNADKRICKSQGAYVSTGKGMIRLVNSYGLDLQTPFPPGGFALAGISLVGKDGLSTAAGRESEAGREFYRMNAERIGIAAAQNTLARLNASSMPTGMYRVVIRHDAMRALLSTFSGIFSAENAQKKLSMLAGQEGSMVASPCMTLIDDPLLPEGFASRPFDAEGTACRTKKIVENGILNTLLHSRKTALRQGVQSTGNASRSINSAIRVAPSNFFISPGNSSLDDLLQDVGDGLILTELGGLHAGANPISGDFSLISKGFRIEKGCLSAPVEQITVAGNFYRLMRQIRAVANDLEFKGSAFGSPSVDAGEMSIAGSDAE